MSLASEQLRRRAIQSGDDMVNHVALATTLTQAQVRAVFSAAGNLTFNHLRALRSVQYPYLGLVYLQIVTPTWYHHQKSGFNRPQPRRLGPRMYFTQRLRGASPT